jgi:hypothetical protein
MCDSDCSPLACGDGHANTVAGELCDDGNVDACGSCGLACSTPVTPTAATGSIIAVDGGSIADGDTITIDDGFHTAVVFEFDKGGQLNDNTHVEITLQGASDTDVEVAQKINDAIDGVKSRLDITPDFDELTPIVQLTNTHKSSLGNVAIIFTPASTPPTGFVITGMSGGLAGDCGDAIGCTTRADCRSNLCVNGTCQACVTNSDCGGSRTCSASIGVCGQ